MPPAVSTTTTLPTTATDDLRQRAQSVLRNRPGVSDALAAMNAQRLIGELQLHQIELEIQCQELLEARAEQQRALQRYTELYDNAPLGYFTLAPLGDITKSNLVGASWLGLSREQLHSRRLSEFVAKVDLPAFNIFLAQSFAGQTLQPCEVRLSSPGVVSRMVRIQAALSRDTWESDLTLIDITADVEIATIKNQSLHYASTACNHLRGMVGYWDANLICRYGNEAYLDWYGKTSNQLLGMHFRELAGEALYLKNEPEIRAALGGQVRHFERTLNKADGSQGHILANYYPDVDRSGQIKGFFSIGIDVTDLKQAQLDALLANRELSRSNADLTQFAYVASHDLQEPLSSIRNCMQLLQRHYHGVLDARADEFINHAVSASQRMEALIDDLLNYSQVGAGDSLRTNTDCTQAFNTACSNLGRIIFESTAQITHDALPHVQANARQITQLFQNLLDNAIKFRGEKSAVVHVGVERDGGHWVFSVADQGIGIAPEHSERIFEVFKRLHTREEYGGTGIGLALCGKIVERHEGRIWVNSALGQGSTFFFTLPA